MVEFKVNTYITKSQSYPNAVGLSNNGFVITWASSGQDGSDDGVYAQIYDSNGNRLGPEFRVNTYTLGDQSLPNIAALNTGELVIAWNSIGQDGSIWGIYAQQMNSDGSAVGSEFMVNSQTLASQYLPEVACLSGNGYVITWTGSTDGEGNGVFAQRYDNNGNRLGVEFQVNTDIHYHQDSPSISALSNGGFVITWYKWMSLSGFGTGVGIYAQIFNSDGAPQGSEFQVNTYSTGDKIDPGMAGLSNGGFVITWQSKGQDGSGWGIYAQRYDGNGIAQGSEFRVNTYTQNDQERPVITGLSNGGFVITWQSDGQDGSGWGIYAQRYDGNGIAQGSEFKVNSYTQGNQIMGYKNAALPNGGFVITWQSYGQDGSEYGVYAQRYDASGNPVDQVPEPTPIQPDLSPIQGNIITPIEALQQGPEFRVNTYIQADQVNPSVIELSDGNFIVVWASKGQDGSTWNIFGQKFDVNGNKIGVEFRVNDDTTTNHITATVVPNNNGGFVVVFDEQISGTYIDYVGGGEWKVKARSFDNQNNGSDEIIISGSDINSSEYPSAVTLQNGNLIFTWTTYGADGSEQGVYAQIFDQQLQQVTSKIQVNTYTQNAQQMSQVAELNNGNFIITWVSSDQDGSGYGIFGQIFDLAGNKIGSEFRVNTSVNEQQYSPAVKALTNGFVVAWQDHSAKDGSSVGIFAQRYDNNGNKIGVEFQVNTYTNGDQADPIIIPLENGSFVIVWNSGIPGSGYEVNTNSQDGSGYGVYAQLFNSQGEKIGSEFRINTYTQNTQMASSAAYINKESFVITWQSNLQDGSGYGVYAQIFKISGYKIEGTNNNDILIGSIGNDNLIGSKGDDSLEGKEGADILDGKEGVDTLSYTSSSAAVTVNLLTNTASGGDAEGDVFSNFENILGSAYNDILIGDNNANNIEASGGNDVVEGKGGADSLNGGSGIDTVSYASSPSSVRINLYAGVSSGGDAQGDILTNFENIIGSAHNDILIGDNNDNIIEGKGGADILDGSGGTDTLTYANSPSSVTVNLDIGVGSGGDAEGDIVTNFENIIGSDFNDILIGNSMDNEINGGNGNDVIKDIGGGNDVFYGGSGADRFIISIASGITTIKDLVINEDIIDLSAFTEIETFDDLQQRAVYDGYTDCTSITLSNYKEVRIPGVHFLELTSNSFILTTSSSTTSPSTTSSSNSLSSSNVLAVCVCVLGAVLGTIMEEGF